MKKYRAALLCVAVAASTLVAFPTALAQSNDACGSLANAYGPYDYRVYKDKEEVLRVDRFHFTPLVEQLVKPMYSHFAGDFDYTLRAVPNHHRALLSMARHSERVNDPKPPGANYTTDCYFDRAIRFASDDYIVRMIYAGHLGRIGRTKDAMAQLDLVVDKAGDNPFTHYNAGLSYLEIKAYEKAREQAHAAARLGLPRTELRDALKSAGQWKEPDTSAAASAKRPSKRASAAQTVR